MVMHVTVASQYQSDGKYTGEFHVSQDFGKMNDNPVLEVYADGDELEAILRRINGIPTANGVRSMTWRAPFAQFILDNLTW